MYKFHKEKNKHLTIFMKRYQDATCSTNKNKHVASCTSKISFIKKLIFASLQMFHEDKNQHAAIFTKKILAHDKFHEQKSARSNFYAQNK